MTTPTNIYNFTLTPGPLDTFIFPSCTMTMMVGLTAPTQCLAVIGAGVAIISAMWPALGGNMTTNYCLFSGCGGAGTGTCIIRGGDGLPVELLDFYIEESGDSQSEGSHPTEDRTTEDDTVSKP